MSAQLDIEDSTESGKVKLTTKDVESMLWNKYTEKGEHILLFNVPDVVGLRQTRRCDAIAVGMWGSTGRLIQGFEIKASRSDWLREVKMVDKADPFIARCDRWWLVTADISIAQPAEIPESWGWMNATKTGLRIQRPAAKLPQDEVNMQRLWAYALIRKAFERGMADSPEWHAALRKIEDQKQAEIKVATERRLIGAPDALAKLQARVDAFEKASGMKLEDWRLGDVGKLARTIHELSDDGYRGFKRTLQSQADALKRLADNTAAALAAVDSPALGESDDL
jgi:hypothetical protein